MHVVPSAPLSATVSIPRLGLGVFQVSPDEATHAVLTALQAGYRHIDTAAYYRNEREVGAAVRASLVPRDEVFVTTKVWFDRQGREETRRAVAESAERLDVGTIDLVLIHWPAPRQDRYVETWQALLELRDEGVIRAAGVSNFTVEHLRRVIAETGEAPPINQVELHPRFQQHELRAFHAAHDILTEAWSPLAQGGALLTDPVITDIAERHDRTPAQIVLAWHLTLGHVVIPKSVTPERIRENLDVFGFVLGDDELAAIAALDDPGGRIGPDPARLG